MGQVEVIRLDYIFKERVVFFFKCSGRFVVYFFGKGRILRLQVRIVGFKLSGLGELLEVCFFFEVLSDVSKADVLEDIFVEGWLVVFFQMVVKYYLGIYGRVSFWFWG